MDSSDEEKANICLMIDHKDKDATFHFSCHDLLYICKKLNKEISNFLNKLSPVLEKPFSWNWK